MVVDAAGAAKVTAAVERAVAVVAIVAADDRTAGLVTLVAVSARRTELRAPVLGTGVA